MRIGMVEDVGGSGEEEGEVGGRSRRRQHVDRRKECDPMGIELS